MEYQITRCKCPHLIIKGKTENLGNNVLINGKHYQLEKIKIGKNFIKCKNIKDFPTGKLKITNSLQINQSNGLLSNYASLNTNVESGYSAKSFPNHILEFYKYDNGYRLQTTPMVGATFLPN